ncbi:uncharacterized protein MONBRDRAFT_13362 [Monosiga brevicollis MX1]|uniref:PITH domain-containing protein n=1 Tax=Monosiga brevicollis TaxID=81824 RepID=A9UQ88_MONBE|nr:uncharacterized protein MONBRDRAFT_13362 [Monosiga brevicollis MX1]EDQ92554.1 predicted protein [Monosiga brevicollis MX1]|eukprot:XP_001742316.1 hypothetical protein [Monosiga brevicollis MX1]
MGHGHGHGHGHSHGDGCDDHDEHPERGVQSSLFDAIDLPHVTCLNEAASGSIRNVFKPYHEREDRTTWVESDADEQLIVHIPFTGDVKLKSITVIAEDGDEHPTRMVAFKNRDDIDFDNADSAPSDQTWQMNPDPEGRHPYETLIAKFNGLRSLTLYFPECVAGDVTKIYYIGLSGECKTVVRRSLITVAGTFAGTAPALL